MTKEKDAGKTAEMKKKGKKLGEEFKDFIAKGDVMDLAIGMVIGAAFTSIVTSLVNDIIMPIVGLLVGGVDFTNLEVTVPNMFGLTDAAHIKYGNFIQAIVNFLIVALTLFLVMKNIMLMKEQAEKKLMKKAAEEEKKEDEKEEREADSDERVVELLTEIRDAVKK